MFRHNVGMKGRVHRETSVTRRYGPYSLRPFGLTNRAFRVALRSVTALSLVMLVPSCSDVPLASVAGMPPKIQLVATTDVDFSKAIVAVDSETACVLLTYSPEVRCLDKTGVIVGTFGAQGQGPGEFQSPTQLIRGSAGSIGVLDVGRSRLSVWTGDGILLHDVRIPFMFTPVSSIGTTVFGTYENPQFGSEVAEAEPTMLAEIAARSGEVVSLTEIRPPTPTDFGYDPECEGTILHQGSRNSRGEIVFGLCFRDLVFWRSTDNAIVIRQPYSPDPLSATDREEIEDEYRRGLSGGPHSAAVDEMIQMVTTSARTPYNWNRTRVHDGWDRLWVALVRDRIDHSYFHVYSDTTFVDTVEIRDRLLAFDIVDSTLVALVARKPTEGWTDLWRPALDWYRLSGEDSNHDTTMVKEEGRQ